MESLSQPNPAAVTPAPGLADFERAYLEFLQSLHALVTGSHLQEQLTQSYADYQRVLQQGIANEQTQRAAAEAYGRHVELLQRALSPDHTRQRAADAFQRYLQAVRAAWAAIDERAVPPAALAAIGQSMTAVALTIAGVIGAGGVPPSVIPPAAPP